LIAIALITFTPKRLPGNSTIARSPRGAYVVPAVCPERTPISSQNMINARSRCALALIFGYSSEIQACTRSGSCSAHRFCGFFAVHPQRRR